ncbi:protein CUSTOS [Myripristis murdjan]|uniref:Protein CUSTOS n=1 Tax=Myripristis murdjan TaxID=586833 RepID=A0A668A0Z6_9TELE|nr:protein CUSTOS [Myripristis murdjan]
MAAPVGKMVGVCDDSSSSEDEDLEKFKEAVWDNQAAKTTDAESNGKHSGRVVVSEHEHDGNELQVTQGFRTHVAKKLGQFLDSYISETQAATPSSVESPRCDESDEGFRLFSTSIPGQIPAQPTAPVRRRPVPSSSDSDSEMETRLREAAVSVADLLPSSSLPSTLSSPTMEPPCTDKVKKKKKKKKKQAEETEQNPVHKKEKKRKVNQEEGEEVVRKLNSAGSEHENSEEGSIQPKVKKKKKKKQKATEGNAEGDALN